MGKTRLDLVGRQFGFLKVTAYAGLDARRNSRWACICECGEHRTHTGANLKRGNIISCGCKKRGARVVRRAEDHPDFHIYSNMKNRCENPNNNGYRRYGGRGITVCDRWREGGFWVFNADMGDRPSARHSIDRIDNNKGYGPDNCRWATAKQQGRNRSTNRLVTHDGVTLPVSEWAERLGINYRTLLGRLRQGSARALRSDVTGPKFNDEQVREIHRLSQSGVKGCEIAKQLGASQSLISEILSGKKYSLAKLPPLPAAEAKAGAA
jgi:hypothetical protein